MSANQSSSGSVAPSSRPQREAARRVLDEAARMRRARKALESLERDNFHEDPHANLVMSKKALNLFRDDDPEEAKRASRKKTRTSEYYKQRWVQYKSRHR